MITGLNSLNKTTGISVQSLRTCLGRLKSTGEITIKSTNKNSLITICNFDQYQLKSTGKSTSDQQTTNNQSTTTREVIEGKEDSLNGELSNSPKKSKYQKFIDFFNEVKGSETGRKGRFKGDGKSKRQFEALLKENSAEEIASAVQAMFRDKHHRESGYKWATPELVTRPDKFARFLGA